jgi:2-iminoacetate synthase
MNQASQATLTPTSEALDFERLKYLAAHTPVPADISPILAKARELRGLSFDEVASLLQVTKSEDIQALLETAQFVKEEIYGKRMVLFAPLYTSNICQNNCTYCGFRTANKDLKRVKLDEAGIRSEVLALLKQGHKRLLLLNGETPTSFQETIEALRIAYDVSHKGQNIRRINVEIAPLSIQQFQELSQHKIGTYTCFQETYDPVAYKEYHLSGPKSDFNYRLDVMDRAMEGGIDDVGVGVLFGLADYKFEILSLMAHAEHLEKRFGCGPHTISVPRIEPAPGAPLTHNIPHPVSDDDFRKIIAILRIAVPYTGIILSTRESESLRKELFKYGVSQISAGSKTNPGGYENKEDQNAQFSLGDHRSLSEVVRDMVEEGFVPSFCTGCYRQGRVGNDFMDLAKPGLIKEFCLPNGLTSFAEYLNDYGEPEEKEKGFALIRQIWKELDNPKTATNLKKNLEAVEKGQRDVYY